jgi:hypothetical protein
VKKEKIGGSKTRFDFVAQVKKVPRDLVN